MNLQQLEIIDGSELRSDAMNKVLSQMSENHIGNHALPFGVAPNFMINGNMFVVPMVTEESSVIAATAFAAKFWSDHGGFRARVLGTKKSGHLFFILNEDERRLQQDFPRLREKLKSAAAPLLENMIKRGGGISDMKLVRQESAEENVFELVVTFETADSMGANLINSCLETMADEVVRFGADLFPDRNAPLEVIMAILSNYTPECVVACEAECEIRAFEHISDGMAPAEFVHRFRNAVNIATVNTARAVTHNKGIFNGMDAVLLATGNDYRAVEAGAHAWASRDGKYRSLTSLEVTRNTFRYDLTVPLAVGTIGGATSSLPMAKIALTILQHPGAETLMQIVAAAGLASNFAAIRSLISGGIQKGHMKLHLNNMLYQQEANEEERERAEVHFVSHPVSFKAVSDFLISLRNSQ